MRKEYRTINEVVGPLMMVENVQGIKYDELAEIEQGAAAVVRGFARAADIRRKGKVFGQKH